MANDNRKRAVITVLAVEEFPDWVDLIAFGVLFVQGAVQGALWTRLSIVSRGNNSDSLAIFAAIRRALSDPACCGSARQSRRANGLGMI